MTSMWIDVHAHFTPPLSPSENESKWHSMRAAQFLVPSPYIWSPPTILQYLNTANIQMQLLSNIPKTLPELRASNDYGSELMRTYPDRFGFLAALPTDNPTAALEEIDRVSSELKCDGFAVTCHYNGIYLGDPSLDPVWAELDRRRASVFCHPNAYAPPTQGRPAPLIEVAFETARTVVDMLYASTFRKFPNIKFIIAHCGGALPALSGRLKLLGTEAWVPNPNGITREEMEEQLKALYLDTAATGSIETLAPALAMTTPDHIVYGSDCGVPCSTDETLEKNRKALRSIPLLTEEQIEGIGSRAFELFPSAAKRVQDAKAW